MEGKIFIEFAIYIVIAVLILSLVNIPEGIAYWLERHYSIQKKKLELKERELDLEERKLRLREKNKN